MINVLRHLLSSKSKKKKHSKGETLFQAVNSLALLEAIHPTSQALSVAAALTSVGEVIFIPV